MQLRHRADPSGFVTDVVTCEADSGALGGAVAVPRRVTAAGDGDMESISKAAGLEYQDRGDGDAVLLVHGGVVADAWLPVSRQPSLTDRFRVIWYRRRGYGGSDAVAGPFSIADQARDAFVLLQELGVEKAHIVGHSAGGAIAIRLALDAPTVVHSLVLLEPAVFTDEEAASIDWIEPLTEIYRAGESGKAIHLFMKTAGGQNWRAEIEGNIPNAGAHAERDAAGLFEGDLPAVLETTYGPDDTGRIAQPVLYITGAQSRPQGKAATRLLAPHLEEAVIPGVNHSLQMVAPLAVAEKITEFIAQHPIS
jgi:pimeloyl-ACP methyl ester carboxylesterase